MSGSSRRRALPWPSAGAPLPGARRDAVPGRVRAVWSANACGALWGLKHALGRLDLPGARLELVTARGFSQDAAGKAALARLAGVIRLEARGVGIVLVLPPAVETEVRVDRLGTESQAHLLLCCLLHCVPLKGSPA